MGDLRIVYYYAYIVPTLADHRKRVVFGPENTSYRFQFGRPTATTLPFPDVYGFFVGYYVCIQKVHL